jgi:hypothetical protein
MVGQEQLAFRAECEDDASPWLRRVVLRRRSQNIDPSRKDASRKHPLWYMVMRCAFHDVRGGGEGPCCTASRYQLGDLGYVMNIGHLLAMCLSLKLNRIYTLS